MEDNKYFICPITQCLFVDPISVPCCGQTYSRNSLIQCLLFKQECPMCRGNLEQFNAASAAKNVVIASLIEEFADGIRLHNTNQKLLDWKINSQLVVDRTGNSTGEYYQTIQLNDANLSIRPTLFIAVCDRSGSMIGKPWDQVANALLHMIGLSNGSRIVQLGCIMYESTAEIIDVSKINRNNINQYFTGGGTAFNTAFCKIGELLRANKNGIFSRAVIAFMTDGQSGQNIDELASQLQEIISNSWIKPCTVHSIGFGDCDKNLLELLRKCGSNEGVFRFSDTNDNDDILTIKITDLFDEVHRGASIEVTVNGEIIQMPIKGKTGKIIRFTTGIIKDMFIQLAGRETWVSNELLNAEYNSDIFNNWARQQIDRIANHLLEINECKKDQEQLSYISVIRQQISKMETSRLDKNILDSLELLKGQIKALQSKQILDIGRLRDLRFASRFVSTKINIKEIPKVILQPVTLAITSAAYNEPKLIRYKYMATNKNRNLLQTLIMSRKSPCKLVLEVAEYLHKHPDINKTDILYTDLDGNNSIHLAAFDGQYSTLKILLNYVTLEEANCENLNTDTAFTLAIKKQGWDKTLAVLVNFGLTCCIDRLKSLHRFCIDNNYIRTSIIISNLISAGGNVTDELSVEISKDLSPTYIKFLYNSWKMAGKNLSIFWPIALSKGYELFDLAKDVYNECKINVDISDLLNWCYPKKPDATDTAEYLKMAEFILNANPGLINQSDSNGETPLHKSVEKGSLPHVKLMIALGANIEARNDLGNTPIWLACAKKYPCIVEELLDNGADVNAINLKGNPPLYTTCQSGPLKIAEMLLIRGANAEIMNNNKDTLILIATRNGQSEILEVLLRYVRKEFVEYIAPIDGFNAVFASVEANKPDCIDVLYRHGLKYNQHTAKDNIILADSTPLHLAAYYNRIEAAQKLIEIGVEIDPISGNDLQDMTPLQIATIQGNIEIVKLLIGHGADKTKALMFASGEIFNVLVDKLELANITYLSKYWHPYWNTIDTIDSEGYTPLSWAVLSGNLNNVEELMRFNADPTKKNIYGLSSRDYAKISRQVRIMEIVGDSNLEIPPEIKNCLFLSCINNQPQETSWQEKMSITETIYEIPDVKNNMQSLTQYVNKQLAEYIPMAKLRALNMLISKRYIVNMGVANSIAIELYRMLGNKIDNIGYMYALQSLSCLPDYTGEVFVNLDRRYSVGNTVTITKAFWGSSLWRIAIQDFNPKTGTVGIFKGCCKYLGGSKCEVIVMPKKFTIMAMYRYDPICLGQPNIRSHTFKIKDSDMETNKAIILEFG